MVTTFRITDHDREELMTAGSPNDAARLDRIERRLQTLEDAEAIRNLKVRYAALCDDHYDADGIAALFTEDSVWDSPGLGRFEGREAILWWDAGRECWQACRVRSGHCDIEKTVILKRQVCLRTLVRDVSSLNNTSGHDEDATSGTGLDGLVDASVILQEGADLVLPHQSAGI
jgi:hypothetical protein